MSPEGELALLLVTLTGLSALLLPTELGALPLAAAVALSSVTVLLAVWWFVHRPPRAGPRRPAWWHGYWAGCAGLVGLIVVVRLVVDQQWDDRLWYSCLALGLGSVARLELIHFRVR